MIESFVEGRVRLRSPLLGNAMLAETLKTGLLKIEGVRRAEVNLRTKGLLLEYDKNRLPLPLLLQALPLFDQVNALQKLPDGERFSALKKILSDLGTLLC